MEFTRRGLLRAGGLVAGGTLAGCLGDGSNVRYPETESDPTDLPLRDAEESGGADTPEPERRVEDGQPQRTVPNPDLASATERIFSEVDWFARQYPKEVEQYKTAMERAANRVQGMSESTPDEETPERLDKVIDWAQTESAGLLDHHAAFDEAVDSAIEYHVDIVEKFTGRGDWDRVAEELARLAAQIRSLTSDPYIEQAFPRNPIRNKLVDWLSVDDRVMFELWHEQTDFTAWVYDEPRNRSLFPAFPTERRRDRATQFQPLEQDPQRTDGLLVEAYAIPDDAPAATDQGPPAADPAKEYQSICFFIEQYADARQATAARQALFENDVSTEDPVDFGDSTVRWRQVYYRASGDVVYAYLAQAGRYLLMVGPSERAWEERVDWGHPLDRTWVWSP